MGEILSAAKNEGKEHLISCYFTKAQEFVDPTDPTKGGLLEH